MVGLMEVGWARGGRVWGWMPGPIVKLFGWWMAKIGVERRTEKLEGRWTGCC